MCVFFFAGACCTCSMDRLYSANLLAWHRTTCVLFNILMLQRNRNRGMVIVSALIPVRPQVDLR